MEAVPKSIVAESISEMIFLNLIAITPVKNKKFVYIPILTLIFYQIILALYFCIGIIFAEIRQRLFDVFVDILQYNKQQ